MSKTYSRSMLTKMFNLNDSEKGVITHKFGCVPKGSLKKIYSDEDVKSIKEMLYWKREGTSLPDFVSRFGIPRNMVQIRLEVINAIPDSDKKMVSKGWYISPKYLNALKAEFTVLSEIEKGNYITSVMAIRKLKISSVRFKKYVSLFGLRHIIRHPLHSGITCIPIEEFHRLKESLIFIDDIIQQEFTLHNTRYVNKNFADQIVGIELLVFEKLIKHKLISDFILLFSDKKKIECVYVSEIELKIFHDAIKNTISVTELNEYDKRFNNLIMIRIINGPRGVIGTFPRAFQVDFARFNHYRIHTHDIDLFLENELEDIVVKNTQMKIKDPNELLVYIINENLKNSIFPETILSFKEYTQNILNGYDGGKHRDVIKKQLNNLEYLIQLIQKEIFTHSDAEIELLFRIHKRDTYYLAQFLNYLLAFKRDKCNFKNNYLMNTSHNKTFHDNEKDRVYSFDQWAKYAIYAMNLSIHYENALQLSGYSRAWLYVIFHFVGAWRKSDILDITGLEMISAQDMARYLEILQNDNFKLSDAEIVIESLKSLINVTIAIKNKQKMVIVVPEDMKVPLAIALLISENHRRNRNEDKLFGQFGGRNLVDALKSDVIQGFANLKANRTLLSLFFVEANKESSLTAYAYELGRQLRSHKQNYKTLCSDTTAKYIYAMNDDGDVNEIAYELLRRGTFGYVFTTLIDIAGQDKATSTAELSNEIVDIRNTYSSLGLESAASQVIRTNEMKKVINEITSMPITEVKKLLKDLALGKAQSKTIHTHCLKYSLGCPYEYVNSCFGCPYNIPSTYAMRLLNDKISNIIRHLNELSNEDTTMNIKYSRDLFRHLSVLQEFKTHFDQIDKNYLSSFIDIEKLKQDLIQLQHQGKLMNMET